MKINRFPALLLCLALLLLTGCSGGEPAAPEEDAAVVYSQCVFPGMEMSAEQEAAVRAVEGMLSAAVLDRENERLSMENTVGFPFTGTVTIRHLDKDGAFVGESRLQLDEWPSGGRLRAVPSRDHAGWTDYHSAEIGARFLMDGLYLSTRFLSVENDPDGGAVKLRMGRELPLRLTFKQVFKTQVYLLSEVETVQIDSRSALRFTVTKESGNSTYQDRISYRILRRKDGVIVGSGSVSIACLEPYETAWLYSSNPDLEDGDYLIELSGPEIEQAAQADVDAARASFVMP